MLKFSILVENQTFYSPKLLAACHPSGCYSIFFSRRKLPDCKTGILFLATETWWAKLAKKGLLVLLVLIYKVGWPQSNRQGLNQRFSVCTRWVGILVFFHSFFDNLINLNCQNLCLFMKLLCLITNFFQSFREGINRKVVNFEKFWNDKHWFIRLSMETWLTDNPNFTYVCGSSRIFKSSVSKTADWKSSTNVSVDNFICL